MGPWAGVVEAGNARRRFPERWCAHASIGANATIPPGLMIGGRAMVDAGAVVIKCVRPDRVATETPAQAVGYVRTGAKAVGLTAPLAEEAEADSRPSRVRGVSIRRLPPVPGLRESLTFGEARRHVPFSV